MEEFSKDITRDLKKGIQGLAIATHAHIKEDAQTLHSFRKDYLEALGEPEQIDENLWVITLKESAVWIEDGISAPYDMKPGLLNTQRDGKSEIKTSKDGKKYRIVPMNQGKTPSEMSPNTAGYEQGMVNKVKAELAKKGIPYKKLELDKNGSPRLGKLHSMNIDSFTPGKGNTPQLHGLNIYQTKQKDGSTKRTITTFRTVTEDQNEKWIHPPVEPLDAFNKAEQFAIQEWENTWLPKILEKYR